MSPAPDFVFVERLELGGNGARVAVKDSIDIAGTATRMGCACLANSPPARHHADVVRALLAAGCRIVGKTNLHELAYGVTGINGWTGTPVNPRAPDRVPGGSSSGSAVAVASELVAFSIGNDTGGSIRIPACCCGIYGLKPTFGRISRSGVLPSASSLDCVGPLARDMPTIEQAMAIIDPAFRAQGSPTNPTVAWLHVEANPAVIAAGRGLLASRRMIVREVSLPSFDAAFAAGVTIIAAETWRAFGHLIDCPALGADVRTRLLSSRDVAAADLVDAEAVRETFRREVDAELARADALALPTLPDPPLRLTEARDPRAALRSTALVRPFNLSGHPAITVPLEVEGLPAGLQLVGRAGEDEALCALARTLHPYG